MVRGCVERLEALEERYNKAKAYIGVGKNKIDRLEKQVDVLIQAVTTQANVIEGFCR